jgi:hypothetical protein
MTINGTYLANPNATVDIRLWPGGPARLAVSGTATVEGAVLFVQLLGSGSMGPFEIITANQGLRGKFIFSIVVGGSGEHDAILSYTPTSVIMKIVPKRTAR